MNIIWKQSNGQIAVTSIFDETDPVSHAAELQARGDIPADWECVSTRYQGVFPVVPQESWRWDGGAITTDSAIIAGIKIKLVTDAVQAHLDAPAKAIGYDDIKAACTYADEPSVPLFQQQGQAFRAWRSLVWAKCYEILADVEAETRTEPTITELLAELPVLTI